MAEIAARAAAHARGLPPKVPPSPPACTASISSARPVTAPMGNPPPRLLAVVTMSGTTPSCSHAYQAPVRPNPDWISSATSTIPFAWHQAASPASQPGSGTTNPPSPAMGSTTTQAIEAVPTVVSSTSTTSASAPVPRNGSEYGAR